MVKNNPTKKPNNNPKETIKQRKKFDTPKKTRRDHGNSSRSNDKRNKLIKYIALWSSLVRALEYSWIAESTLNDWLKRDDLLSEEYNQAKNNLYFKALQWQNDLIEKGNSTIIQEVVKAHDARYSNKIDVEHSWEVTSKVLVLPALNDQIIDITETEHLEQQENEGL